MRRRASWSAALALCGLVACGGEQQQPPPRPPDTPVAGAEDLDPTPPPEAPPNRVGLMPLLRGMPYDARCRVEEGAARRLILEGDTPTRTATVGLGPGERAFAPATLNVVSSQQNLGQEENESVYVVFDASGNIETGRRQYYVTGGATRQDTTLLADDTAAARSLAQQVFDRCNPASGSGA